MAEINDRARPRHEASRGWQTGKGRTTFSEAVSADAAGAIRRADAIVAAAVPDCHPDLRCRLVGRAVLHGSLLGAVNRGELAALHARLRAEMTAEQGAS